MARCSDGKPYCQHDYHALNGSLCAADACGKPVEGGCVSLAGEENGDGGRCQLLSAAMSPNWSSLTLSTCRSPGMLCLLRQVLPPASPRLSLHSGRTAILRVSRYPAEPLVLVVDVRGAGQKEADPPHATVAELAIPDSGEVSIHISVRPSVVSSSSLRTSIGMTRALACDVGSAACALYLQPRLAFEPGYEPG